MYETEVGVRSALGEPLWINDGKPVTWMYYRSLSSIEDDGAVDVGIR